MEITIIKAIERLLQRTDITVGQYNKLKDLFPNGTPNTDTTLEDMRFLASLNDKFYPTKTYRNQKYDAFVDNPRVGGSNEGVSTDYTDETPLEIRGIM